MNMKSLYSKSVQNVPEGLTKPTKSFRKHVWLAVLGLLFFIIVYVVLIVWFGQLAYDSFLDGGSFWHYILAGGYAFLCLFMVKSLFVFNKREKDPLEKYITQEDEPVLFDYLYQLADEAGAPRPKKVFLSPRVNASVSYDISILNLIIPSKKNLEIGLGLMNVLNLGELKAVLAHEFGHFAQRSMLLGRYVYVAQKVAVQIINKRDVFDSFLAGISSIDLRIAWVGWILSILVWAVRSLIETCFSIVTIAQRALSREMEFQADLVAVSLTGSDALIHALSRLQAADEAYDQALETVNMKLGEEKAIHNLYKLQTNYIEKMSWVLNDSTYGQSPKIVENNPESNRVFVGRAFNPPKMWSTHPADKDREENAKNVYIPAEIDDRSAEILLSDATAYEIDMTARLIATSEVKAEVISDEEAIEFQNKEYFSWTFLDPKYESNFLNRMFTLNFEDVDQLYIATISEREIAKNFDSIYSKELGDKLEALKEVKEEKASIELIVNEPITIEKREIWHRGDRVKRKDVKAVITALEQEEKIILNDLNAHDIRCRSTHYKAALLLGGGWARYLKTLGHLVHYSEHAIADLNDAARKYHNVVSIALADGNISSEELTDILNAGYDYFKSIRSAFLKSHEIKLNKDLLANSNKESYAEFFEEFKLQEPTRDNINEWSQVVGGWASVASNGLNFLRNASLEHLLDVEEDIKTSFLTNTSISRSKPEAIKIVESYKRLTPGSERPIQSKLKFWDRFMMGEGVFGASAKFAASVVLIGGALLLGSFSRSENFTIYNGLGFDVTVDIEGNGSYEIPAGYSKSLSLGYSSNYDIVARSEEGEEIEHFTGKIGSSGEDFVYNVANAGVFYEYTAYYGYGRGTIPENRNIGAGRWFETKVDYILKTPPVEDEVGTQKDVLVAYSNIDPYSMISVVSDSTEIKKLIHTHVKWTSDKSEHILSWIRLLSYVDNPQEVLNQRIANYGDDMIAKRAKMDTATEDEKAKICEAVNGLFEKDTENADLYYLKTRCLGDSEYQDATFVKGHEKWRNHNWLAYASAYIYAKDEKWTESLKAFNTASGINGLKGVMAIDADRVRRMASRGSKKEVLNFSSEELDYYLNLDRGGLNKSNGDINYVYVLIAKGQLKEAYEYIKAYDDSKPYILRYLAVSKGVSKAIIQEAKELKNDEGITSYSVWYALAFNILENRDYSEAVNYIERMGVTPKDLNAFIVSATSGNYNAAERIIKQQHLYFKGFMYALGYIVSKSKAPEEWKDNANTLLLANEIPFLGV